jgi:hypothetical protein
MTAWTVGCWKPAPTERTAHATRITQRSVTPFIMRNASPRVASAVLVSATMIRTLRFTRSANVPPKTETMPCGRKAATA